MCRAAAAPVGRARAVGAGKTGLGRVQVGGIDGRGGSRREGLNQCECGKEVNGISHTPSLTPDRAYQVEVVDCCPQRDGAGVDVENNDLDLKVADLSTVALYVANKERDHKDCHKGHPTQRTVTRQSTYERRKARKGG